MEKNQYLNKLKKRDYSMYQYFMRGIEIVTRLNEKMYEAYFVGGVVRDYLLNKNFKDIDISTNATPSEILELFPNGDSRYADMGCIEIRENKMIFQITTFRNEDLVKTRKTKDIHYSKKLMEDVTRRDYTVNALAMSSNLNIIDVIKGVNDLKNQKIRVIGKASKRFSEDPLRIFRGFELVARYNFEFTHKTAHGIKGSHRLINDISPMKLTESLWKILSAPYGRTAVYQLVELNVFKHNPTYVQWLYAIYRKYRKVSIEQKFTLLYYLLGQIPNNTCFERSMLTEMQKIMDVAQAIETQDIDVMVVFKYGSKTLLNADQIIKLSNRKYKSRAKFIKQLDKKLPIKDRRDMNFTAEELIQLMNGRTGPKVSEIMDILLSKVVRNEILNNNSLIRQEALKMVALENNRPTTDTTMNPKSETMFGGHIFSNEPNSNRALIDEEVTDPIALQKLKLEYDNDFFQLYTIFIKGINNYNEMNPEEMKYTIENIKIRVRESLLTNNPKYQKLVERGLI